MIGVLDVGTVCAAVEEVDADLTVHTVVADGLLAVRLAVERRSIPGSLDLDEERPALPSPSAAHGLLHFSGIILGFRLDVHVVMTTHAIAGIGDPGIEILDREGRSARCETVDLRPFLDHAILGGRSVLAARLGRLGCGLRSRSRRGGRNSAVVQRAGRTISVKHFSRHAADHTVLLKLIVLLKIAHRLRRETAKITGDFIVIIAQIAQTHL